MIVQNFYNDEKIILASSRPEFYFSSNNLTIIDEFLQNSDYPMTMRS